MSIPYKIPSSRLKQSFTKNAIINEYAHLYNRASEEIKQLKKENESMMDIVKAVAHIGIDWGYGAYELEEEKITAARAIYEANNKE
jgi:hypothetical protein